MTEQDVLVIWQRFVDKTCPDAVHLNVKSELAQVEEQSLADVNEHLQFWLNTIDEALHFLLQLHKSTEGSFQSLTDKTSPALIVLLARACTLTTAVRRLVVLGLEEAARPVARSLLETLDLAIVTMADEKFAEAYWGDKTGYDANEFWKQRIAAGKIDEKIRNVLRGLDFSEEAQKTFFVNRKADRKGLSSSVHASLASAFTSMYVPSLTSPGFLGISLLGHVSAYSPGLLSWVVNEIYHFGSIALKHFMLQEPPRIFSGTVSSQDTSSLFASFLTLQEIINTNRERLPPPIQLPK